MRIWCLMLMTGWLEGSELQLDATGILHYEHEKIHGKEVIVPLLYKLKFKDDNRDLATFYSRIAVNYVEPSETFGFNAEVTSNLKIDTAKYDVPYFIRVYDPVIPNTALVSMASIDYYHEYFSLSAGRNKISMEWMEGSMDGLVAYTETDYVALRLFWMVNFYDLQTSYYIRQERIGDHDGMYGVHLQNGEALPWMTLSLFLYKVPGISEIYGGAVGFGDMETATFNVAVSAYHSKDPKLYGFERYLRIWSVIGSQDEGPFVQFGASLTGDVGLSGMLQFGLHPFTPFYLNNAIDRSNARNVYAGIGHNALRWYVEGLYGKTQYEAEMIEGWRLIRNWMRSDEVNIYAGYQLLPWLGVEAGWMSRRADSRDYRDFSQEFYMANVMVSWP